MNIHYLTFKGKVVLASLAIAIVLTIISLIIGLSTSIGLFASFRIVFGVVYVLFLPGFILTFVFFPRIEKSIDFIERIALSFALSIAVVPLVIFYLNLAGIPISQMSTFLSILGIIVIESIIIAFQHR